MGKTDLKYRAGHQKHTSDCMSEWGERGRHFMTPQTVAVNHRLHMADVQAELHGVEAHNPPVKGGRCTVCDHDPCVMPGRAADAPC